MNGHEKGQTHVEYNPATNTTEPVTEPNTATNTTESTTSAAEPTTADPNDPNATVEIIISDNNHDIAFRMKKNVKMGKVMARYAEQEGRNRATMRFLFDGDKIVDSDTPASVSSVVASGSAQD